jgi:regulator of PEP synthase PpsR (kinase-PPPase family)
MRRSVFFISDHTCITAETVGRSLLSQFPALVFDRTTLPFLDSEEKLREACRRIDETCRRDEQPPLVFSTLADPRLRRILRESRSVVFDLFDVFIGRLEEALGLVSVQAVGRAHGLADTARGRERVEALKFTLDTDDGLHSDAYDEAEIILVGVSRSGKTPACLYLALHYDIRAANYPLAEEDLERTVLPPVLQKHRSRLFGLTLNPERLHQLRQERRPGSRYASLRQCRDEIRAAEALFKAAGIPVLDSSNMSVEEIAANVLHRSGMKRPGW